MTTPYVNPIGAGLHSARIDMGVDYTGAGPLYALGSGTIVNVANAGWPGGKFISLKLDSGPYAGKYVFYAENIIAKVRVGQHVTAGQLIGTAVGKYPFIEVGWAAPPGTGQTMAAAVGQQAKGGDPGEFSTAFGVSMSNLIKSLGGPGGILTPGGVRGTVSAGYPGAGPTAQTTASLGGTTLPGCVPLIGVMYLAIQSCKRIGRIQSSKRAKRKVLLAESAEQGTGGGTIAGTGSGGTQSGLAR